MGKHSSIRAFGLKIKKKRFQAKTTKRSIVNGRKRDWQGGKIEKHPPIYYYFCFDNNGLVKKTKFLTFRKRQIEKHFVFHLNPLTAARVVRGFLRSFWAEWKKTGGTRWCRLQLDIKEVLQNICNVEPCCRCERMTGYGTYEWRM